MTDSGFQPFPVQPIDDLADLRGLMPVVRQPGVYLDHAAAGVLPQPVVDALLRRIRSAAESGVRHWNLWERHVRRTRQLAADLIGADAEEIAFVPNTSAGIALLAEGFRWRSGDNVVLSRHEFPSNRFPWMNLGRRGVQVRLVDPPADDPECLYEALETACDERTRILACSWVDYATGIRRDPERLAEIIHRRGGLLVLDIIQGCGVLPLHLHAQNIDAVVTGSRKWLLAPEAAGFLAVRRDQQDRFDAVCTGWAATKHPLAFESDNLQFSDTATRFESGMRNILGLTGLHAALTLLNRISPEVRAERLLEIRGLFLEAARSAGLQAPDVSPQAQSGLILARHESIPASELVRTLFRRGITVNLKRDRIRISPHLYNTAEDADVFRRAVRDSM